MRVPARYPSDVDNDIPRVTKARERYRDLVESSGLPAVDVDLNRRLTYVSPAYAQLLGYTVEELLGRHGPDLVHPDDRELTKANFERRLRGQPVPPYRVRLLGKDGEVIPAELYASPLQDEAGDVVGLQCIVFDQRPVETLERRLAHSERRFHSILQATPDLAFVKDREGRFTDVNQTFLEQTGLKREEVIGKTASELWSKELAEMSVTDDAVVYAGGVVIVERPVSYQGRDAHILIVKAPLLSEDGQVSGLVGFVRDVTDIHRERERVELSERRYRAISKLTFGYVLALRVQEDGGTSVEWLEGAFEEITGRKPEGFYEAGGLRNIIHPDDRDILEKRRERVLRGEPSTDEFRILRPDGSVRWVRAYAGPEMDENGQVVRIYAAIADITHEKELQERAQLASRFAVLGQLAAGLGHDLNNMMQVIVANLEMALSKHEHHTKEEHPARKFVEKALRASENLTDLSRRLVHFARPPTKEVGVVNITEHLRHVIAALDELLPKAHHLKSSLPEEPMRVRIDAGAFQQVVANLVLNARDAMPDGGVIRVSLERQKINRGINSLLGLTLEPGEYAVIHVDDTGEGIPEEMLARIFDPFVTSRRGEGHSGLGLAIVLQAVAAAGGLVDAKNREPQGTRFTVAFPLDAALPHGGVAEGKAVLFVEDEEDIRQFAEQALLDEGYQVFTASSGEDAIRVASQRERPFDLALLDVTLPGIDGVSLANQLREKRLAKRIAFATAHVAEHDRATLTLVKPFGRDELIQFVAKISEPDRVT